MGKAWIVVYKYIFKFVYSISHVLGFDYCCFCAVTNMAAVEEMRPMLQEAIMQRAFTKAFFLVQRSEAAVEAPLGVLIVLHMPKTPLRRIVSINP